MIHHYLRLVTDIKTDAEAVGCILEGAAAEEKVFGAAWSGLAKLLRIEATLPDVEVGIRLVEVNIATEA